MKPAPDSTKIALKQAAAFVVLGFCLALFGAVLLRGALAPQVFTSIALVEPLVEPGAVKKHMRTNRILEAVRAEEDGVDLKVLSRRLVLRTVSQRQHIELQATDRDPDKARALLHNWLDAGFKGWDEESPQGMGPFILIESPSFP